MTLYKVRGSTDGFWVVAAVTASAAALYYGYLTYFKKKARPIPTEWEEVGTVAKIFVHPIKSARPITVNSAKATTEGISIDGLIDRSFIVYSQTGQMITGRNIGEITTLRTAFGDHKLTIRTEGGDAISLDITELDKIQHWQDFRLRDNSVPGVDCGDEVSDWLTRNLCKDPADSLRLIYKGKSYWKRTVRSLNYFKFPNFRPEDAALYQDTSSYMVMTESSMEDLNSRLETPVHMGFFRPCIVVTGSKPYDEDNWTYIKFGEKVVIHEAKPREICNLTQVDPSDGTRRKDHFDMLNSYRTISYPDALAKEWKTKAIFGVHCGLDVEGDVTVGDKVYVNRSHNYWSVVNSPKSR